MVEGTVGMGGFPPCAGFFSKDSILRSAFQSEYGGRNVGYTLYAFGLATALLTALQLFRLIFLTCPGKQRYDEHHVHVHESPKSMLVPLMILAVLSLVGGWFAAPAFLPGGTDYFAKFMEPMFSPIYRSADLRGLETLLPSAEAEAHSLELLLAAVAVGTALIGFLLALWLYLKRPGKPEALAKSLHRVYNTLLNKYYVDELYAAVVVKPLLWISTRVLWKAADVAAIHAAVNVIPA